MKPLMSINDYTFASYSDKKRCVDFIPSGNYANFYAVLKKNYGDLRAEWILQGNLAE